MTFLQKIFAGLRSAGLSEEKALGYAEMIERRENKGNGITVSDKVAKKSPKGDKVSNGGTAQVDDMRAYARSRKGNTFTLAQLASKLGVDANNISPTITQLVRKGEWLRVGRGEYVCSRGTC